MVLIKINKYRLVFRICFLICSVILTQQVSGQILRLDFPPPFRFKQIQGFENGENWSVGGFGNLVINSGNDRKSYEISKVDLNSIFFINDQTVFIVGRSGEILLSRNRGKDWKRQSSEVTNDLNNIFCVNEANCWIAGDNGLVLKGGVGKNWEKIQVSTQDLFDIFMVDSRKGYLAGENNEVYKTVDGGLSWTKIEIPLNEEHKTAMSKSSFAKLPRWQAIHFRDYKNGCIAGMAIVSCTSDGGILWNTWSSYAQEDLLNGNYIGIVYQTGKYIIVDSYGTNLNSSDSGKTWVPRK